MTRITLYGLKTCDTCKKALKALEHSRRHVDFVDIRAEADLSAKVPVWLDKVGAKALLNTRSTTWRELSQAERTGAETDPAGLLIAHPTLIKRPVIEWDGHVYVGWTNEVQSELAMM